MDVTTPETALSPPRSRPSALTLPVVLAGVVLVAMSISGTAVALPGVGQDLGASGSALNWVVAGYNLAFAAMTLVAGSAADRVGRRRTFLVSALVFSCGFLVTAVSQPIVVTDVSRIVSGAGGAGVMAAGGAILASSYEGAARNRAFALMGAMAGVGLAVGPTLSGLLISATGWRGSSVVLTVAGLLITSGATRIRESRSATGRPDWPGSILFVNALTLFMFALLEAPSLGWTHSAVVGPAVGGLVALVRLAPPCSGAKRLGIPLGDVAAVFSTPPTDRAPTHKDWQRLSLAWKAQLEDRRRAIEALEHELTGCIGCGCLSMKACLLLNPDDSLGEQGPGPVRLQNTTPPRHSRRT
ncbi:MFS transporter [Streptomyces tendae]|uniref:MFS transporter n=1 Tax=Streptomyces tendae TaxID=1932 RepID=UPI0036CC97B9